MQRHLFSGKWIFPVIRKGKAALRRNGRPADHRGRHPRGQGRSGGLEAGTVAQKAMFCT
jgi:hypothetical protein